MPDLGLNRFVDSLNPMPFIEVSRAFGLQQIKGVISSSLDFVNSNLKQVEEVIVTYPDQVKSCAKQIQDFTMNLLTGFESGKKAVLERIGV